MISRSEDGGMQGGFGSSIVTSQSSATQDHAAAKGETAANLDGDPGGEPDRATVLNSGDALRYSASVPHSVANAGDTATRGYLLVQFSS